MTLETFLIHCAVFMEFGLNLRDILWPGFMMGGFVYGAIMIAYLLWE